MTTASRMMSDRPAYQTMPPGPPTAAPGTLTHPAPPPPASVARWDLSRYRLPLGEGFRMRRRAGGGWVLLVLAIVMGWTAGAAGQQVLLSEDFENGAPGWTRTGTPIILWHVANAAECGSITRMAAYNRGPGTCTYNTGGVNTGRMRSPPLLMAGTPPFLVSFDYMRSMDTNPAEQSNTLEIVDTGSPLTFLITNIPTNSPVIRHLANLVVPADWAGRTVRFEFAAGSDTAGNNNLGFFFDNFVVTNSCAGVCPGDFNCDGAVNSQDFFDFLTAFFASAPSADFNHDAAINSQDFFDFLTAFFAGC